jgi:hypothetical protein
VKKLDRINRIYPIRNGKVFSNLFLSIHPVDPVNPVKEFFFVSFVPLWLRMIAVIDG